MFTIESIEYIRGKYKTKMADSHLALSVILSTEYFTYATLWLESEQADEHFTYKPGMLSGLTSCL